MSIETKQQQLDWRRNKILELSSQADEGRGKDIIRKDRRGNYNGSLLTQMNEKQIDYIIELARKLEYQKLEREAQTLQEAKRLVYKSKELTVKRDELLDLNSELKHYLSELRYNKEHPDPPIDLGNGTVKLTLWKALPREREGEREPSD